MARWRLMYRSDRLQWRGVEFRSARLNISAAAVLYALPPPPPPPLSLDTAAVIERPASHALCFARITTYSERKKKKKKKDKLLLKDDDDDGEMQLYGDEPNTRMEQSGLGGEGDEICHEATSRRTRDNQDANE